MWQGDWRDRVWSNLGEEWDLVVVGGGITGAGILREATRLGLRTLLLEGHDFGWGTSSRSSKLVHGGLRYLREGKVGLTRASVHERERLLEEGPGLIDPLGFLLAAYKGDHPGRWTYSAGLSIYDLLALHWSHRRYRAEDFELLAPHIKREGLEGGFRYGDAQTDDARLVLRVIREAVADGGTALNYAAATELLREDRRHTARVVGVRVCDRVEQRWADVRGRVVINATGAWADRLRAQVGAEPCIRPLRGSHLIFPAWRLPVAQAVSFLHPVDRRPVFIFPWEGITLVGTTDVDHGQPLDDEPRIDAEEVAYLMAAVEAQFPSLGITLDDIVSTFAGVRPVIGSGKEDPSKESRDHSIWQEGGMLTVTGGKLTTFRLIALDALKAVRQWLPDVPPADEGVPVLRPVDNPGLGGGSLDEGERRRLLGRYGAEADRVVGAAAAGELDPIPGTSILWAELRWAARAEGVVHLDDLLLRRVRFGHLLPEGGKALLPRVRAICQPELGWDDRRWAEEERVYTDLWQSCYAVPNRDAIPDWRVEVSRARERSRADRPNRRRTRLRWTCACGLAATAVLVLAGYLYRRGAAGRQEGKRER